MCGYECINMHTMCVSYLCFIDQSLLAAKSLISILVDECPCINSLLITPQVKSAQGRLSTGSNSQATSWRWSYTTEVHRLVPRRGHSSLPSWMTTTMTLLSFTASQGKPSSYRSSLCKSGSTK